MGLISAALYTAAAGTLVVTGVVFGSPALLAYAGLSAVGPVAGGMFAATQGTAIAAGSW